MARMGAAETRARHAAAGAGVIWSGLLIAAVIIAAGRVSGGFEAPVSLGPMIAVTAFAAVLSLAAALGAAEIATRRWTIAPASAVPIGVLGAALLPAERILGCGWLLALLTLQTLIYLAVVESRAAPGGKDEGGRRKDETTLNCGSSLILHPSSFRLPKSAPHPADEPSSGHEEPELSQWLTRRRWA
ncbi:MAG: hypothetical protein ACREJB_12040, partial [Planctomycetaceae bacterium]